MEDDVDTDPYEGLSPEETVAFHREQWKRFESENRRLENKRLKERPIFLLLGAAVIVGLYLGLRQIFGEPESFWGCLGQILPFTIISIVVAGVVSGRVGEPTNGTSGGIGVALFWLMCTGTALALLLFVAGVSDIFGNVEVLQWAHLVASLIIGGLAILVMMAL